MLNAMRLGHLSPGAIEKFRKLSRPVIYDDGIEPTDLSVSSFCRWLYAHLSVRYHLSFPTRREVDNTNGLRLNRLPGPERRYDAADVGGVDFAGMPLPQFKVQAALERLVAPKFLTLKAGLFSTMSSCQS